MEKIIFYFFLLIFSSAFGQLTIRDALCPRIYLQIRRDDLAQKVLDGVYTMQGENYQNFPIYKSEMGDAILYYRRFGEEDRMFIGDNTDYYVMTASCAKSPTAWREWWSPTAKEPFNALIRYWYYYDGRNNRTTELGYHGSYVTIMCVGEAFVPCSTRKLYFNKPVTLMTTKGDTMSISEPNSIFFEEIKNTSVNVRPVYKKVGGFQAYLYYEQNYWFVSLDYRSPDAFMRCQDMAMRPEYMTCTWELHTGGTFRNQSGLQLECRGANVTCNGNQSGCLNGAGCGTNSLRETVCFCPRAFQGDTCQQSINLCPQISEYIPNSIGLIGLGRYVGDSLAYVCHSNARPATVLSRCTDTSPASRWIDNGLCIQITTTTYKAPHSTARYTTHSTTPYYEYHEDFNFGHKRVLLTVITVAVVLQIVLPICAHCCWCLTIKKRNKKAAQNQPVRRLSKKEAKKRKTEIDEQTKDLFIEWGKELADITKRYSEIAGSDISKWPVEARQELGAISEKYKGRSSVLDSELKDIDPEAGKTDEPKKFYLKKASFGRTLSIFMCISFWLWVCYISICAGLHCKEHGEVFNALNIFAYVMIPLSWLYMALECIFSRETQYLKTLGDDDNARMIIDKMRQNNPVLSFHAVAWHLEMRTRLVTTTDANGNTSTYTETYWERVITDIVNTLFDYDHADDHSDNHIEGIRHTGVTKIKMNLFIEFGDQETENVWYEKYNEFQQTNRHLDVHVDFSYSKSLPEFKKRVATFMDKATVPKWMKRSVFLFVSFLGLSWIFRVAFQKSVASVIYDVRKKVYLRGSGASAQMQEEICADVDGSFKMRQIRNQQSVFCIIAI